MMGAERRRDEAATGHSPATGAGRDSAVAVGTVAVGARRDGAAAAAESAARRSYGRLVAILAAADGDLALAEDTLQDAFAQALATWPTTGVPANPEGWLITVARNRQRDTWKSAAARTRAPWEAVAGEASTPLSPLDALDPNAIGDGRLELLFVCAHPAIDASVRVPLMLQVVLGFDAAGIAAAFATAPATMAQRLVRAKRRIRDARIPFALPSEIKRGERLPAVLEAVYGCFAIAWDDAGSTHHTTPESLAGEALHLAVALGTFLDTNAEAWSLAALIALSQSRSPARAGAFVPLDEQDPKMWDAELIAKGEAYLRRAAAVSAVSAEPAVSAGPADSAGPASSAASAGASGVLMPSGAPRTPGRFQLEAAMQAVHVARRQTGEVDWPALGTLSTALLSIAPSLGARVAHAAITGRLDGPRAGLAELERMDLPGTGFQPYLAVRADLLARAGDPEASAVFTAAADLARSPSLAAYLRARAATSSMPASLKPAADG
jgi:predicted RNA polymerase sigma factor